MYILKEILINLALNKNARILHCPSIQDTFDTIPKPPKWGEPQPPTHLVGVGGHPDPHRKPPERGFGHLQAHRKSVPPGHQELRHLPHGHQGLHLDLEALLVEGEDVVEGQGHLVAEVLPEEGGGERLPVGARRAQQPPLLGGLQRPPLHLQLGERFVTRGNQTHKIFVTWGKQTYKSFVTRGKQTCKSFVTRGKQTCKIFVTRGKQTYKSFVTRANQTCKSFVTRGKHTYKSFVTRANQTYKSFVTRAKQTYKSFVTQGKQTYNSFVTWGKQTYKSFVTRGKQTYKSIATRGKQTYKSFVKRGNQTYESFATRGNQT